jgi:hypothetical protein
MQMSFAGNASCSYSVLKQFPYRIGSCHWVSAPAAVRAMLLGQDSGLSGRVMFALHAASHLTEHIRTAMAIPLCSVIPKLTDSKVDQTISSSRTWYNPLGVSIRDDFAQTIISSRQPGSHHHLRFRASKPEQDSWGTLIAIDKPQIQLLARYSDACLSSRACRVRLEIWISEL